MQLDPRPEPAPMTDAEIAKLILPKGKESFVHWYFMHIDLEPDLENRHAFLRTSL